MRLFFLHQLMVLSGHVESTGVDIHPRKYCESTSYSNTGSLLSNFVTQHDQLVRGQPTLYRPSIVRFELTDLERCNEEWRKARLRHGTVTAV